MARWKPIESAPLNRAILVDGGTWEGEINGWAPVTAPVKVILEGGKFNVCDTDGYAAWVREPEVWTDLPTRALKFDVPRPEYDL